MAKKTVNTIRFVCKLYKSGTTGVYDFNNCTSVTEMLRLIKPFNVKNVILITLNYCIIIK